ncbi:MAG: glycosyltransferase [Candidatus Latescibacteria bacterium]|nr:glycosyltransferase [Candidatus Latescibacterota bacterium]NIM21808.1 glycosyltransferase [Candidatus Latescibacterota bacterium]NIM65946.1 glycosyltransferase [Candidatus Latescibacterota bacterium]NIO02691.1 glycosyltransferase [Candidatus Latescibacterota bacterium]NIO29672.1 glycosyltransferase [Candidatus Latescibacterota bacterium]
MDSLAQITLYAYISTLLLLSIYGIHRYFILYLYFRHFKRARRSSPPPLPMEELPRVTVQLPFYNEYYVAKRVIEATARLDYPKHLLTIQVLDDSTDQTQQVAGDTVEQLRGAGYHVQYLHREKREGYKAGALKEGLEHTADEFVAIFDADFLPPPEFLKRVVPYFRDERVGMVQARWGWINRSYSLLTRLQSILLDAHFILEHSARHFSGRFFNFNGTAGVFRKEAILDSGSWQGDTLTEDLDLSYRAQMKGWRFIFVPDLVCPSELPVNIYGFKTQQHRWTKGSIQVGKKLLPKLWRADIPFRVKLEATFHLSANLCYLLIVLMSVLMPMAVIFRGHTVFRGTFSWEFAIFFFTTCSIFLFYLTSQRELYPDWKWRLKEIPFIFALGIGMCINNAWAVSEALLSKETPFIRTAKYRIVSIKDSWKEKIYRRTNKRSLMVECLFSVYMVTSVLVLMATNNWGAIPYVFLFVTGFIYIFGISLLHSKR